LREQSKNSIIAVKELAFHSSQGKEERKRWLQEFDTPRSAENWLQPAEEGSSPHLDDHCAPYLEQWMSNTWSDLNGYFVLFVT